MLIDEGCVKDVMDKLVPSDFYLRQNREIFETIYTMFTYARPIDGITVCEEMQKAGTYDENTTRSYLAQPSSMSMEPKTACSPSNEWGICRSRRSSLAMELSFPLLRKRKLDIQTCNHFCQGVPQGSLSCPCGAIHLLYLAKTH